MSKKRRLVAALAATTALSMFAAGSPAAFANSVSRVGSFALNTVTADAGSDRESIQAGAFGANGVADTGTSQAGASFDPPAEGPPEQGAGQGFAHGAAALNRLGKTLPDVAAENAMSATAFEDLLLNDPTVGVNSEGHVAFFDMLEGEDHEHHEDHATEGTDSGISEAALGSGSEFELASNPGADKTIYLDFDGHVTEGTWWNYDYDITSINSPAFDIDGSPGSWSSDELRIIREAWLAVSEDFAPWNINVTTIDPGPDALNNTGDGDTKWGVRVVITRNHFSNCGCSGHAYTRGFGKKSYGPAFVYSTTNRSVHGTISHEVGHTLGLSHDGSSTRTYYGGHAAGNGAASWGPIMGAAGGRQIRQWSQQEFTGANNNGADQNYGSGLDDITIISSMENGNRFGLRADDHGDDLQSATPIAQSGAANAGIISTRTDVDVFSFTTTGGTVDLVAAPAAYQPNLDIQMILRDESGSIVAAANPPVELGATISIALPAGTYSVEIDGVGAGDPTTSPPTGYTDYASIGQFTLTATLPLIAPDLEAPDAPVAVNAAESDGNITISWNANTEADLAGYSVLHSTTSGGPYSELVSVAGTSYIHTAAAEGTNYYVVTASDTAGNVSAVSTEVSATITVTTEDPTPPPPPPPPSDDQVATANATMSGSVSGTFAATHAKDGTAQTITEVESGGRRNNRHDHAEHHWTIPVVTGVQTLQVAASASDGGDSDSGFSLEWSTDGASWTPIATVSEQAAVDGSFELGWATGTITIRVIDTDRTSGNRLLDSVSIDMLSATSDGSATPPPATTALGSVTTGTAGAGRGVHYGVATVTVVDNYGAAVSGASVTVTFTGAFDETVTGTTDGSGKATLRTTAALKKPAFGSCVADITADGLNYVAGTEAC